MNPFSERFLLLKVKEVLTVMTKFFPLTLLIGQQP